MPPKRKRATDEAVTEPAAKTTRKSTRSKAADTNGGNSSKSAAVGALDDSEVSASAAKKARRTASKAKGQMKSKSSTNAGGGEHDHAEPSKAAHAPAPAAGVSSAARVAALFDTYADPDDPAVIGPEGFERLCGDAGVSLEGALPLILAWQLDAKEMAKIAKGEWEAGLNDLQISDLRTLSLALRELEDLVLLNKPPVKSSNTAAAPSKKKAAVPTESYNRTKYFKYASDADKAFMELYMFCFALAKPPQARNIDIETACAFWTVLVVPKYPLMADILLFIGEKATFKGVNKDLWTMTLEFCRTIDAALTNYDPDGAWPSMLDDFAAWKKSKSSSNSAPVTAS